MTIEKWLELARKKIDTLDADLIALKAFAPTDSDRSWLTTHNVVKITIEMQKQADKMLEKRVSGVPLAYILGEREFYGRKFVVNPDVLIPRPETETLIDMIRELPLPKQPSFLEIGTGSGCIAVTLALEFSQAYVLATDVSPKALDVAYQNDIIYEGRVEFIQSNLLRDVQPDEGRFDVLVANLPYVDPTWDWLDQDSLSHEPSRALYVKQNGGLALYQRLFRELRLRQGREFSVNYAVVEADPCQHAALTQIAERQGLIMIKSQGFAVVFERRQHYQAQQHLKRLVNVETRLAKTDH